MHDSTTRPQIAVCLAAYNGMQWIDEQITSIKAQEGVDVTLYISVDVSTDGTESHIRTLAEKDDKIVLLPYGDSFGGAAPNFFRLLAEVDFTPYDYVALSDQDDIWLPDKLFRGIKALATSGADGYSSNVTAFWENGRERIIDKAQTQREFDYLFEAAGPGCTYVLSASLANKVKECVVKKAGEIKNIGLHDWFIYAFARSNGFKWIIDPAPSMLYRQHSTNQVGVNQGFRAFHARSRKILNGWGFQQASMIAQLVGNSTNQPQARLCSMRRKDLVWLAVNSSKFRRRLRDRYFFAASCIGALILYKVK
ncbi:glycosyltransferase [Thauera sp.]|uniref:glycosyltransferase n=1 Tax=Thauera sp. TaxID=1905334 RepID=UPI002A372633|nr:glycosyltransferase [Thauera sp.]MDX9885996.1 glycosyltransferase [Thauera sp.]